MSRQIGSFNHEELIVALVAITAQLFFLIPQKSLLAEIGGESTQSCPHSFILFTYDWQIGLLNSDYSKRLSNTTTNTVGQVFHHPTSFTFQLHGKNKLQKPPNLLFPHQLLNQWEELMLKVIALSLSSI